MTKREMQRAGDHALWVLDVLAPDTHDSGRPETAKDLKRLAENVLDLIDAIDPRLMERR